MRLSDIFNGTNWSNDKSFIIPKGDINNLSLNTSIADLVAKTK